MPRAIADVRPLGFPWHTEDPFLFCVHHDDAYPRGNALFGPDASLAGRDLGQDFSGLEGWRMYHGERVPGFPQHPHRGFETVTIVRRGLVDHSDSLGAAARFGHGDVQWLTTGKGIVHAEMFPLLDRDHANPLELFQIWLNLPRSRKLVDPHFSMLWDRAIPTHVLTDARGRSATVRIIAGPMEGADTPPPAPPSSWASQPDTDVAIWTIRLDADAELTLPTAKPGTQRWVYFFRGPHVEIDETRFDAHRAIKLVPTASVRMVAGDAPVELLVLQGRPIAEPVVQYGPFVMSSRDEIVQAFDDYRRTGFGGWPWREDGPVHGPEPQRFARHIDGRLEYGE